MRERPSEVVLNLTLALATLVFAGVLVRREVGGRQPDRAQELEPPTFVSGWETLVQRSRAVGPVGARMQLVEFVDYECGFCRGFEQTRATLEQENPGDIAISFVHLPIQGHRFARLAAIVAECARDDGRFAEMHTTLFRNQDSLGLKPWAELAHQSGVTDTARFRQCLTSDSVSKRVDADLDVARRLTIRATPTLLVNGWKLSVPPDLSDLTRVLGTLRSEGKWHPPGGRDTVSLAASKAEQRSP